MSAAAPAAHWPRRQLVIGLSALACFIAYTDRVNISVAAIAMQQQFGWSETQKGFVLSAFFIGYMAFMFPSGALSMRFGGKRVLGVAVLAWSAFTLLTPLAAGLSFTALVLARIGMGLGEAAIFPAAVEMFGRWVPPLERARAMSVLLSGIPLGTLVGLIATGWIVAHYDWPMAFYSFGALGIVWALVWFPRVYDAPQDDPGITRAELDALRAGAEVEAQAAQPAWREVLLRKPVAAIVAAHFATTWNLYVLLSWLPSYFKRELGLGIANVGLFSAAPWLAMFLVASGAAAASDRLIARGVGVTSVRKTMQCMGLIGPALFLFAAREVHSAGSALALMCCATGALGCTWSGYAPNGLDIAPRHASLIYGFSNTFATIPGIVGVAVTGWLVDVTGTYSAAFVLTAAVSVLGAAIYAFLFDARPLVLRPAGAPAQSSKGSPT